MQDTQGINCTGMNLRILIVKQGFHGNIIHSYRIPVQEPECLKPHFGIRMFEESPDIGRISCPSDLLQKTQGVSHNIPPVIGKPLLKVRPDSFSISSQSINYRPSAKGFVLLSEPF